MTAAPARRPFFRWQKPMAQVLLAVTPALLGAVFFFGWQALGTVALACAAGTAAEWLFCRSRGEPVSLAVLVSAVLFALTLPPGTPWYVTTIGIVVGIVFAKEVFGGFGRNAFNPALIGRCFVYLCFPVAMTGSWPAPCAGFPGGFAAWAPPAADGLTAATPLRLAREGAPLPGLPDLLLGRGEAGSLGETSAPLILLGAAYLLWRRTANWRIVTACLLGAALTSAAFHYGGSPRVPDPLVSLAAGGLLFGAVFMATDPISAARTDPGRWLYGLGIGALAVIIRGFSNFSGGVMFAILLLNIFNPLLDLAVNALKAARAPAAAAAPPGPGAPASGASGEPPR